MMKQTEKTNQETLNKCLSGATGIQVRWTIDAYGNPFGWLRLDHPSQLVAAAKALAEEKARLCTVTAYAEDRSAPVHQQAIAYHFALHDAVVTVTAPAYDKKKDEVLPVPSITPWFRNADWNEREFMEMFKISIVDHPNPKRLFLDERLDAGIMSQLIPFSAMVHGVASRSLWEQVMAARGIDITGDKYGTGEPPRLADAKVDAVKKKAAPAAPPEEPAFTPVSATEEPIAEDQAENTETQAETAE